MTTTNHRFVLKAMCLFENGGKVLLSKGGDSVKGTNFYRPIGGKVEFGEPAENTIRREIREELESGIENLKFLSVFENIFEYEGKPEHEVIFLFKGGLARKELYEKEKIIIEGEHDRYTEAFWMEIEKIKSGETVLLPEKVSFVFS